MSSLQARPHKGRQKSDAESVNNKKREYVTAQPLGPSKVGLDVISNGAYYVSTGNTIVTESTSDTITLTSHGAYPGDVIRITSSTNSCINIDMAIESVTDANTFVLVGELQDINGDAVVLAAGDTFDILRPIGIRLNSTGAMVAGPIEFLYDGTATQVTEDTGTPANNRPLPVKLTSVTGDINITANDLHVQLSHSAANPDSVQIGDGTEIALVNASGELQVRDDDLNTDMDTLLTLLPASLGQKASAASLAAVLSTEQEAILSAIQTALQLIDNSAASVGTDQLRVDIIGATDVDIRDLTDGRVAAGIDRVRIGDGSVDLNLDASGDVQVDVLSSALPTGASTAARQDTANTALAAIQTAVELLDNTVSGTELQVDVVTSALPTGAATETTLDAVKTAVEAIQADQALDIIETIVVDFSSTNVTDSAYAQILASTAGAVKEIFLTMSTGDAMYLATGAAASEVNKMLVPPGGFATPIRISIAAATRLSLTRVDAGTTSSGKMYINLLG